MIATQSAVSSNRHTVSKGVHSQPVPVLAPRSRGFDRIPKRRGGRGLPRAGAMDTLAKPPQEWSESSLLAEHSRLAPAPSIVVFSGGTAFNSVAADFKHLTHRVTHVLPVSDDGGSTAEIVRVLGGPAVGDIRSRCLRLAEEGDEESDAVRQLLGHRLSTDDARAARLEWYEIVEGTHPLWKGVSEPYKHTIRAFLVHFQANILSHASRRFTFSSGSVGNFFFAGARLFFRSLEAAIFLFSRVARIPEGTECLPAVCTEGTLRLGAELADGSQILGQSAISHPSAGGAGAAPSISSSSEDEDATASLRVDKHCSAPLPCAVRRVFYVASDGDDADHEVALGANPRTLAAIARADAVVYGMGSLYTSIAPSLVLTGVGEAVAARACPKILVLNGGVDRETGRRLGAGVGGEIDDPKDPKSASAMTAADVVRALTDALNRRGARRGRAQAPALAHAPSSYFSAVLAPRGGGVEVDEDAVRALLGAPAGQQVIFYVDADPVGDGEAHYRPEALVAAVAGLLSLR